MAHSSICTLNPIMQTEILKVVDWQGESLSHFAKRNGTIYLVSAHWCHRTCAEVNPTPERPVVEVLV